jgi:hypothetical protein
MPMKPFTTIAVAILVFGGLIHLVRFATGFQLVIAGFSPPLWGNAIGAVVAFGVAWKVREEARGAS